MAQNVPMQREASLPETSGDAPLRVLHVAETLPGGIATYLREVLSAQIVQGGQQVRVLAPQDQLDHLAGLPAAALQGYARSGRNLRSLLALARALRRQVEAFRPQIVHLHSSFAGAVGRWLRPSLPDDVRWVYCPHGWAFSRDDHALARRAYVWVERLLARRADAWVAISRHELETAIAHGIAAEHAQLIGNGVADTQALSVAPAAGFARDALNLLFVGRHDRQKGLDLLLAAMAQLRDCPLRLHVVGSGVLGAAGDTVGDGALPNVRWLGWRSGPDLLACYRACDALVMPSRWEGFGLAAIEAMREGKPVLAANCGALGEIVEDGVTGRLFAAGDVAALTGLLASLDRGALARAGSMARQRYLGRYTIERTATALSALYGELAQGQAARGAAA